MAIPELNANGLLPVGLHDCTFDEMLARFGQYQGSAKRPQLCERFKSLLDDVRLSPLFSAIVVDGSFVTGKPVPNDIDLILVVPAGHNWAAEVRPFEYNMMSKRRAQKLFGFDVVVAEEGTMSYTNWLEFFEQVKEAPSNRKGLLRVLP